VTSMKYMFDSASAFNQDLRAWSVKKVTDCLDMMRDTPKQAKRPKFRLLTRITS